MAVEFDRFYEWCKERFGEANLKIRHTSNGDEICTHSFIAEEAGIPDHKFHLWMNPAGGKTGSEEHGAWRCWYTEQFGTLVGLVSKVDNISFVEAEEMICDTPSLRTLEAKVHEFFSGKAELPIETIKAEVEELSLPDFTSYIDDLPSSDYWKNQAQSYLGKRGIPTAGLAVCYGGDFKNRIIIPYLDKANRLRFYNCRTMSSSKKTIRYLKCKESSQEDILYFYKWPRRSQKIYITEGEIDAISLNLCGFNGCACGGKFLSDSQIEIIRTDNLVPVLAFDSDPPGREALLNIGEKLLSMGFVDVSYIRPPKAFKDWNKMMVERNKHVVKAYIERFEKRYTVDTLNLLKCGSLGI